MLLYISNHLTSFILSINCTFGYRKSFKSFLDNVKTKTLRVLTSLLELETFYHVIKYSLHNILIKV